MAAALVMPCALMLAAGAAAQGRVAYGYVTGDQPYGSDLASLFSGYPVAGVFQYDSSVPASGTVANPPTAGSTIYDGAITDLFGSVAGYVFSDPSGRAVVGDDRYTPPGGGLFDILVLAGDPGQQSGQPPGTYDFSGFQIPGYTLQNARLFWIEGMLGARDFLSDQELPASLPDFAGRLALDFVETGTTSPLYTVFFDLLTVDAVGESVDVDIKPGDPFNHVNPGARGVLPVAVLTTDTFDALQVDPSSVVFGPLGARECHARGHPVDVDGDGDLDLVLHFLVLETGIQPGDTEAFLAGATWEGTLILGSDTVHTVGRD